MVAAVQETTPVHSQQKIQLTELPPDVKRKLLSFLAPRDAAQLFCVCKSLQAAALDELVWERFAKSRWKTPNKGVFESWMDVYVSGNGWNVCALQPQCVHGISQSLAIPQASASSLRWKFEASDPESKGMSIEAT